MPVDRVVVEQLPTLTQGDADQLAAGPLPLEQRAEVELGRVAAEGSDDGQQRGVALEPPAAPWGARARPAPAGCVGFRLTSPH